MKLEKFEEQVFFSTVRITIPSSSGKGASIGSGFLCSARITESSRLILLISNRHVYGDSKQPIILNFHQKSSDGLRPELGQVFTISSDDFSQIYYGHPDANVDLACLNVSVIGNHNVFFKNIYEEMLASFSEEDLLPGADVWFIGYPDNRFDVANNLPIMRRGYLASIPKVDFNSQKQFVIDAQVFPGSSGSPVFAALGGSYKLLGVVTQTMIRHERLEVIPTNFDVGVEQVLGLGLVLKASLVKDLIDFVVDDYLKKNLVESGAVKENSA